MYVEGLDCKVVGWIQLRPHVKTGYGAYPASQPLGAWISFS